MAVPPRRHVRLTLPARARRAHRATARGVADRLGGIASRVSLFRFDSPTLDYLMGQQPTATGVTRRKEKCDDEAHDRDT